MGSDKRIVATDALETLGTVITSAEKRDAIHLAVENAVAGEYLRPGDHIGLVNGTAMKNAEPHLGIVDPFLEKGVIKGERFWLVVYPRKITSLRHVWSHPDFPEEATGIDAPTIEEFEASRSWITSFASGLGLGYQELVDAAGEYVRRGEYLCKGGDLEGEHVPDEFWPHYETVTGIDVAEDDRGSFFTCSC